MIKYSHLKREIKIYLVYTKYTGYNIVRNFLRKIPILIERERERVREEIKRMEEIRKLGFEKEQVGKGTCCGLWFSVFY